MSRQYGRSLFTASEILERHLWHRANAVRFPVSFAPASLSSHEVIRIMAPRSKLPGLTPAELTLLRQKQSKLAKNASSTLSLLTGEHIRNALNATLIFARYEAGTAVCVSPEGWVLTCSRCFGDDEEYKTAEKRRWHCSTLVWKSNLNVGYGTPGVI